MSYSVDARIGVVFTLRGELARYTAVLNALRPTLAALLGAALLGAAGPAQAREIDPFEAGGFTGAAIFSASAGETEVTPRSSIMFGVRGGYRFTSLLALEGELEVVPTQASDSAAGILMMGARVHGLFHLPLKPLTRRALSAYLSLGLGGLSSSYASAMAEGGEEVRVPLSSMDFDSSVDVGVGIKFFPSAQVGLRFDARALVPVDSDDFLTGGFELLFGAYARFGSDPPEPLHIVGKPEVTDDDGDLLYGDADRCPTEREDFDEFEDEDGCPDLDNDGDSVHDVADDCPTELEDLNEIDDKDGCPDSDFDSDLVLGSADQCPEEPEDKDDFGDEDGCPDPDNDGDTVPDQLDLCAQSLETMNGFEDGDGCVDEVPADLAALVGVLQGVEFAGKTTKLTRAGKKTLDRAAKILAAYPSVFVEISAHSGPARKHDAAVALTQRRADTVKAYLAQRGVAEYRMTALGFGPDKPVLVPAVQRTGPVLVRKKELAIERVELHLMAPVAPEPAAPPPGEEPPPDAP